MESRDTTLIWFVAVMLLTGKKHFNTTNVICYYKSFFAYYFCEHEYKQFSDAVQFTIIIVFFLNIESTLSHWNLSIVYASSYGDFWHHCKNAPRNKNLFWAKWPVCSIPVLTIWENCKAPLTPSFLLLTLQKDLLWWADFQKKTQNFWLQSIFLV